MGLDKKAMFEKLLEQIKWQDDREVFSDALIEKVEVHTKSKRWDFYLETNDIVPFQTFAKLNQLVETSFRPICKTRLHFTTRNPVINDENWFRIGHMPLKRAEKQTGLPKISCKILRNLITERSNCWLKIRSCAIF